MAKQATTNKRTARDWLRMILSRWYWFLGAAAAFALVVMVHAHTLPLQYTATAEFTRRSEAPSGRNVAPSAREAEEAQRLVLQKELVGIQAVARVVEELGPELGLSEGLKRDAQGNLTQEGEWQKRRLIERMSEQLAQGMGWPVRDREVDVLSISFTHSDPEAAYRIPNLLIENYLKRAEDQRIADLEKRRDWFRQQVADCEDRMANLQKLTVDFEAKYPHILPANREAIQESVRAIDAQTEMLQPERDAKASAVEDLKKLLDALSATSATMDRIAGGEAGPAEPPAPNGEAVPAEGPAPIVPPAEGPPDGGAADGEAVPQPMPQKRFIKVKNDQRERIREMVTDYRNRLDDARSLHRMTEKHPTVVALKARIADLEERLEAEPEYLELEVVDEGVDPNVTLREQIRQYQEQAQRVQLLQQIRSAESDLRSVENQVTRLKAQRQSRQELLDDFRRLREEYKDYLDKQEKLDRCRRELRALEDGFREVERSLASGTLTPDQRTEKRAERFIAAVRPHRPSSPDFKKMMGLALAGGLGVGFGVVFLQDMKDRRIVTTQDAAKHFDLPVVGVIGEITTPVRAAGRWLRRWGLGLGFSLLVLALLGLSAYSMHTWLYHNEEWHESLPGRVATEVKELYGEAEARVSPQARSGGGV